MSWKKFASVLGGAAVGAVTGSPLLGGLAATGVRAATGGKVNLLTLGMDFASGWGGSQLSGEVNDLLGFGGGAAGAAPDAVAGAAADAAGAGSGMVGQVAGKAGVTANPSGLLSGVLDSKWLQNPVVGHALAGIGTELARGDPAKQAGRAADATWAARQKYMREQYRRVPAPSDRRKQGTG